MPEILLLASRCFGRFLAKAAGFFCGGGGKVGGTRGLWGEGDNLTGRSGFCWGLRGKRRDFGRAERRGKTAGVREGAEAVKNGGVWC